VFVRVNGVRSGLTRDDLHAVVAPGLAGVVLPKPAEPQDVRDLDVLLREAEMAGGVRPGDVTIVPLIESPRGLLRAEEILLASDRIAVTSIGAEDYCAELGVERNVAGAAIAHLRYSVVTLAAAHRMQAIDTPYARIDDLEGLIAETKFARAIGFKGKYVLHPDQVEPTNRIFTPSPEDIDRARADVAAFEEAQSRGEGSVAVHGRMVDAPIATRARNLLARAAQIAARRH
jgi:citrate lyase subunit beta/citryl-CoA lyase